MLSQMAIHVTQRKTNTYGLTYTWNLENKTNEQTKQNRNRLIDNREQTGGCQRGGEWEN